MTSCGTTGVRGTQCCAKSVAASTVTTPRTTSVRPARTTQRCRPRNARPMPVLVGVPAQFPLVAGPPYGPRRPGHHDGSCSLLLLMAVTLRAFRCDASATRPTSTVPTGRPLIRRDVTPRAVACLTSSLCPLAADDTVANTEEENLSGRHSAAHRGPLPYRASDRVGWLLLGGAAGTSSRTEAGYCGRGAQARVACRLRQRRSRRSGSRGRDHCYVPSRHVRM